MTPRRLLLVIAAGVVALFSVITGCDSVPGLTAATPAPGSPTRAQLEALLGGVSTVDSRPDQPGYERSCKVGDGCVFGPAWTDDYDGPGGHDGCGTRDNVLQVALTNIEFKPGSNNCVVVAGTLADPYTGTSITFTKQNAGDVQIDHVYPLSAAWDMGASLWPIERRIQFANDVTYELMAVDGEENQSKSDKTPADWMPPNEAYHCFYAGRYLTVAAQYGLPITVADRATLTDVAEGCG
ncbi:HNH endonuclease family protein [Actinomycetes bacterium M1A6_2h]